MADTSSNRYQRLPGTGYRRLVPVWAMLLLFFVIGIFVLLLRGRRVQLWLGDDHLLVVDWDGYREYYKRINYRDIQSVVIHRTAEGKIVNALLGGIVLMFVAFGLAIGETTGTIVLLSIAAFFGVILLINFLAGPTCRTQLRTAVQTEELHSLTRLRTAHKVMDRLRPRITATQGELASEEISEGLQRVPADTPGLNPADRNPGAGPLNVPPPATPPPPRHYQSKVHFILFWLLLVDTPFTLLDEIFDTKWTTTLGLVLLLVSVGFCITALVRQRGTDLPGFVKIIPWLVLGFVASVFIFFIGLGIYLAANSGLDSAAFEGNMTTAITVISTALNLILGLTGLIQLRRFQADYLNRQSLPPLAVPPPA